MRIVRCNDSPINSVVAAGAASYILVSSHSALLAFTVRLVAQSSRLVLPLNVFLTLLDSVLLHAMRGTELLEGATPASPSSVFWGVHLIICLD